MRGLWLTLKRFLDVIVAGIGCLLLSLPMALIGLLLVLDTGLPVFFTQERAGRDGRVFRIFKFRTMIRNASQTGLGVFTEQDDPRITRVGRWLRRWSLDELPQLFNVLKGDMSLVGPRPTLPYQVAKYDERQRKRLLMRPGITGWAQVNGRNNLTWPEKIELDVWYAAHWSFWLDLLILFKTVAVVLQGDKVYGQPTDEIAKVEPGAGRGRSLTP